MVSIPNGTSTVWYQPCCGSLKNTMTTAAIRMGDRHVVHSCGDCEVEVPMGSRTIAHWFYVMDTEPSTL